MNVIVDQFKETYKALNKENLNSIETIYTPDIVFKDPFHVIQGLDSLKRYFSKMYENVIECSFEFSDVISDSDRAALFWTMRLSHNNLNSGKVITVPGSTLIRFTNKVTYHRDYFDAGALVYEQVPILSRVIRIVKDRL